MSQDILEVAFVIYLKYYAALLVSISVRLSHTQSLSSSMIDTVSSWDHLFLFYYNTSLSLSLSLSLSIYLSIFVSLSNSLSLSLSLSLSFYLSLHLCLSLSFSITFSLSFSIYLYLSFSLILLPFLSLIFRRMGTEEDFKSTLLLR